MAKITILTPVYNEEATVQTCYEEVRRIFQEMGGRHTYEHIFGDNRSKDRTLSILKEIAARDPNVKVLAYSRNFGAEKSGMTLMRHATGDACIGIAVDLQEPPEMIRRMVEAWEAGFEVVLGVYTNRNEGLVTRALRSFYYRLASRISNEELDRDFSGFALMDRRAYEEIVQVDDFAPYMRGIISTVGFRKTLVPYERRTRKAGSSKHRWAFLLDFGMNALISYSILPIRLATVMGLALSGLSLVLSVAYAIVKMTHWNFQAPGATTTIVLVLFFSGIQLLFLGILGEYVGAIHSQVRRKPFCIVRERINFPPKGQAG
jgi:glycosyltransferase involved in cell wall biosynthesis